MKNASGRAHTSITQCLHAALDRLILFVTIYPLSLSADFHKPHAARYYSIMLVPLLYKNL
jgi:hypothetical protein